MRQISFKKSVNPMSAHVKGVTAFFATVLVCCISATPLSAHGSTNVFDDAVFWFRGGKDLNGDGYMQKGEFFDDLHANDASHDNHNMSMSSSYYTGISAAFLENALFQPEPVAFPALGTNVVKTMQVLKISNIREKVANKYYFPFDVNPYSIFERNNISNEYTIVSRIRVDHGGNYNKCFVKVGYNASENQGMWLGFAPSYSDHPGCMRVAAFRTPSGGSSNTSALFNLPVPTNTWVDLAVVVGNGKMRVGIATPASLASHNSNPTIAFDQTPMWTDNCTLLGSEHYKLFCLDGQTEYKEGSHADTSCFLGSVQQIAIWRRALNDQEVMAAFGMPRPTIFRTGFDNGSSNEFGGARTNSLQTINGLGSWQPVWNSMSAGDTWTVQFNALRDEANLPQIFSIKALPDSTTALIEPILNGTSLGEGRVSANSRAFWPVAANIVREGENELVITRKDVRTRDFLMDAMELGGSLGVGMVDGSIDDGRTDPACTATGVPSAADPNTQHWPQDLQPYSGITNLHLRVWVDPDVADKASFTFKTRVQGSSRSSTQTMTGTEHFSVYINNRYILKCTTKASETGLDWSRDVKGDLHGGWNDIEFICPGPYTTCHWLFDYYRFEAVLPEPFGFSLPKGFSLIIR